jgi:hypothetical protein
MRSRATMNWPQHLIRYRSDAQCLSATRHFVVVGASFSMCYVSCHSRCKDAGWHLLLYVVCEHLLPEHLHQRPHTVMSAGTYAGEAYTAEYYLRSAARHSHHERRGSVPTALVPRLVRLPRIQMHARQTSIHFPGAQIRERRGSPPQPVQAVRHVFKVPAHCRSWTTVSCHGVTSTHLRLHAARQDGSDCVA